MNTIHRKFRPLGATEKLFWLLDQTSQVHFVIAAEVCGQVDSLELSNALLEIQHRHPLLSSRIIDNGFENPYFEYVPSAVIPVNTIGKQGKGILEREMEKELSRPFLYSEAPLIRCTLIFDSERPVMLFAVHHAISDGISMTLVILDILRALNDKVIDQLPVPLSIDQLLDQGSHYTFGRSKLISTANSPIARRSEVTPKVSLNKISIELSTKMIDKCKMEKTSIQGMLYAAAISTARKSSLPWSLSRIKVIVPISIRKTITEGESSALYINSKALFSEYTENIDFWEIARWAKNELVGVKELDTVYNNALDTRKRLFSETEIGLLSDNLQKGVVREMMISNLGRISYNDEFKDIKLEHIWGPLALSGTKDEITIGVTTVNDTICISTVTRIQDVSFSSLLLAELENACKL